MAARSEYDATGDIEYRVVEEKFERFGEVLGLHLKLADGAVLVINTTGEHPFYRYNSQWRDWTDGEPGDWTAAFDLCEGDAVLCHNGQPKTVSTVRFSTNCGASATLCNDHGSQRPDDPFILFNLGVIHRERGDDAAAVEVLEASLQRSHPHDSIVRKIYALLVQARRNLGRTDAALADCRAGRAIYPDDAELLFLESGLLRETGDRLGSEDRLRQLIHGREGDHFASVDTGLRGYKARHNLGVLYLEDNRRYEAEAQWRAALLEEPAFLPAHLGLAELYLRAKDWIALNRQVEEMKRFGGSHEIEAEGIAARGRMDRHEFAQARFHLSEAIRRHPDALPLRVLLSHAILKENLDLRAAEETLRDILRLAPGHPEALNNLIVLLANQGRIDEAKQLESEASPATPKV